MTAGVSTHQKAWQFIRELNASDEQLDSVAFLDGKHKMTYRQFFCEQDRYAKVFSGLGITEAAGSRVGIVGTKSVKTIVSFFALNMLGVSVSLITPEDLMGVKWLLKAIRTEGITDLVLPDTVTRPDTLRKIMKKRKKLGLRNVIVMRTSKRTPCPTKQTKLRFKQNLASLCDIKGVLYMKDLLRTHEETPIAYGSGKDDEAAAIVHTSGTTKSIHKPIPLSDVALNTAAARMLADERFSPLRGNAVSQWATYPAVSVGFITQVYCALAFGATLSVEHGIMDVNFTKEDVLSLEKHKVNVLFGSGTVFDLLRNHPKGKKLDFSCVDMVVFGGFASSLDQLRSTWEFMHKRGGNPRIVNGYGLSECGAANIVATYDDGNFDVDHGIGKPLAGVSVRVRDEQTGEFFSPEDGEHTGTLYLNSESNSSGRIDQTVFFEPELIDGKPYICTNDLVRVGDSGDIFFLGRGNRYFVNNEGMKFDAGVVETAIGNQKGIAECAIVPVYEKLLVQDTVPVLYVRIEQSKSKAHDVAVVRRALKDAYLNNKTVAGNDLPWQCVIAKHMPLNDTGKVDATRIQVENTPGRTYSVVGVEREGVLVDIRLAKVKGSATPRSFAGIPKKVRKEKLAMMRDMAKAYSPDYLPHLIELFGPDALEGIMDDAQPQAQVDYTAAVPFPFLPMLYARREKDTDDELRGGLNVPKTINSIMRLLFHASNVAHDFEK